MSTVLVAIDYYCLAAAVAQPHTHQLSAVLVRKPDTPQQHVIIAPGPSHGDE
jgi:hypothetical protein